MLADKLLHQFFMWMASITGMTNQEVATWTLLGILALFIFIGVVRKADIY
jgi:hypothetical protein